MGSKFCTGELLILGDTGSLIRTNHV